MIKTEIKTSPLRGKIICPKKSISVSSHGNWLVCESRCNKSPLIYSILPLPDSSMNSLN